MALRLMVPRCPHLLGDDILCESLESLPAWLEHCHSQVTGLAGVDVSQYARFAGMNAADNLAGCAVLEFTAWCSLWIHRSIS